MTADKVTLIAVTNIAYKFITFNALNIIFSILQDVHVIFCNLAPFLSSVVSWLLIS